MSTDTSISISDTSYSSTSTYEGDQSADETSSTNSSLRSLATVLSYPQPSTLARKRKVQCNPPTGVKRCRGQTVNDPKLISPFDRVKQYPDEYFEVSAGKFFCMACREEVSTKKSIINQHVKSTKHKLSKEKRKERAVKDVSIVSALETYDKAVHPVGEQLPQSTRLFRVKTLSALLRAGIPLNKADQLRDYLEESGYSLCSSSHLRQMILFMYDQELNTIRSAIKNKHISIIFDGTTHVAEAFVVVIRYIDDNWNIQQKVAQLLLLSKSLCGEEVARLLTEVIMTKLGVSPSFVVASMHDRASVNTVAIRSIAILFSKMLDVGCYSHTLDHVGEKMNTPLLDEFISSWIVMFSHSPKTKLLWTTKTDLCSPSYSTTRWWSKFEVIKQVHDTFGDVENFLQNENLPPATSGKMLKILNNEGLCRKFKIELAITVDAMMPFVRATYNLEGDGLLALTAYREISSLLNFVDADHHPNVRAVARLESNGNSAHEQ